MPLRRFSFPRHESFSPFSEWWKVFITNPKSVMIHSFPLLTPHGLARRETLRHDSGNTTPFCIEPTGTERTVRADANVRYFTYEKALIQLERNPVMPYLYSLKTAGTQPNFSKILPLSVCCISTKSLQGKKTQPYPFNEHKQHRHRHCGWSQ